MTTLESVEGGSLDVKGTCQLSFTIKGLEFTHTFVVADRINRCALLGDDFLNSHKVRIYFDLGLIRIRGTYISLINDKHINSVCRINNSITLSPGSSHIVKAKVHKGCGLDINQAYMVSPLPEGCINDQPGVEVSEAVVSLNNSKKFPVEITNCTNRYIRLQKGCIVGKIEEISSNSINAMNFGNKSNNSKQTNSSPKLSHKEICEQIHTESAYRNLVERLVFKNLDVFAFAEKDIVLTKLLKMNIE
jgi:hypothetical protein